MPREKSCGAVVFANGQEVKYLLLHYEAGHWDFVKGNVERDESEEDTVRRELREETGIVRATFVRDFKEKISYFYRRHGATINKEVVFFLIQAHESEVRLSYEHVGYEWLSYESALARLTFNTAKKVLKRAHKSLARQSSAKSAQEP